MNNILQLIRPDLQTFTSYSSARDEAKEGKIWLNANESPYLHKVETDVLLNRYPEKQPTSLMQSLAKLYAVKAEQIVLSRGSDEAIDLLMRLFCSAGKDKILICPPTFGMYAVCARLQNAEIIEIPLLKEKDYQLNINAIVNNCDPTVKIIFLCSPNNPTGNILAEKDILTLCEKLANKCIIVVDEAYIEYADSLSLARYIDHYENLVILRTLSKAYGLAGARAGLLLAQKSITEWILKIIAPYPLSNLTIAAIEQTITPDVLQRIQEQIKTIKLEKQRLIFDLQAMDWVKKVWPSEANYLLIETDDADKIMRLCAAYGIVLRSMQNKVGLENCIRISIGLPAENNQLIQVLQQVTTYATT